MRPWQHVVEPLSGYMVVAEKLFKEEEISKDQTKEEVVEEKKEEIPAEVAEKKTDEQS